MSLDVFVKMGIFLIRKIINGLNKYALAIDHLFTQIALHRNTVTP